jgi:hypothetical protein
VTGWLFAEDTELDSSPATKVGAGHPIASASKNGGMLRAKRKGIVELIRFGLHEFEKEREL